MRHAAPFVALGLFSAALAGPAYGEVPVPRLAPSPSAMAASVTADGGAPDAPALPIEEAIRREATVDVSLSVADFYEARDYRPMWTAERAAALRARLAAAAYDGFDPSDYFVPAAGPGGLTPAAEEVALTEAALRYARHATSGRVKPTTISRIVTIEPPVLDEAQFLERLAASHKIPQLLERLHPRHPQFTALREKLAAALEVSRERPPLVGGGPNLKRGSQEARVAVLRSRLGATVLRGSDPTVFDDSLDEAVRAYQKAQGLRPDGIVGPRTLALIDDGADADPVPALVSNMERWRWMPRMLGGHYVMVNVPAYRVRVMSDGEAEYEGRVIVGDVGHPTPIFSDEIEHIVVNPYWNVPISIASNEMLGAIQRNPRGYFARRGYEAVYNGRVVDPGSIAWNRSTLSKVRIRQKPGSANALGAVKFLFPNQHAVYLHDTPSKNLFARDRRALSHGCVRVDDPFVFADALLSRDDKMSGKGIRRMVGGQQRWLNVTAPIPVHLAYFTREIAPDGRLVRYDDIYGFDRRTQKALGFPGS